MAYFVYVLQIEPTGRSYVGQTEDLDRRLAEHNSPVHNTRRYTTKHAGPWVLSYREVFGTRGP
ncbi:MAG: GIY-YIG nuclease family protein [Planctomycetota bacterium]